MEIFGTNIMPQHRHIIPSCIPSSRQIHLQTRIKGGVNIYSISTKSVLQVSCVEIQKWRKQEGHVLEVLIPDFISSPSKSSIDVSKDYHIIELSDGSGKTAILLAPIELSGNTAQVITDISKWQIRQYGKLNMISSKSDGNFKLSLK